MLTVFTPAYNRVKELRRLYDSLTEQTNKNFEWLIVDDGSIDGTGNLIKEFISEKLIDINYIYQENGGKMRAHNRGVEQAKGELFVCIDADDWLTENAVEKIICDALKIEDVNVCGMMYLNFDGESQDIVGTEFPWDENLCSSFDVYNKHGVTGDKTMVFKTEILKEFSFPEIEGEKFVPEALVYNRISIKYKFLCVNVAIKRVEYLQDGISNNYFNICKRSPKAQILYYKELYELSPSLYNAAAYDLYCIYAKKSIFKSIKEHPSKILSFLMYLPAYIKYLLKEKK